MDSNDSRLLDVLHGAHQLAQVVERLLERKIHAHERLGIEANGVFQLTLNLLRRAQHPALLFEESGPGLSLIGKTLKGVLLAKVFKFAAQPLELVGELKNPRFRHGMYCNRFPGVGKKSPLDGACAGSGLMAPLN